MQVLVISSWVGFGHVGLSAAVPVLQALGHRAVQLPTVLLSNHPRWRQTAGAPVAPAALGSMLDAVEANGWLAATDAVLTGYMPTPDHARCAADAIARVKRHAPGCLAVVDPILGDDPSGLYIPEDAAAAIRERLLPRADILTPNRFELAWLSGRPVGTLAEARTAAQALLDEGSREIHVTSAPVSATGTGVLVAARGRAALHAVPRRMGVPNGTGDVYAALLAARLPAAEALGRLDALIEESLGADHLRIAETAPRWTRAAPLPTAPNSWRPDPWPSTSS